MDRLRSVMAAEAGHAKTALPKAAPLANLESATRVAELLGQVDALRLTLADRESEVGYLRDKLRRTSDSLRATVDGLDHAIGDQFLPDGTPAPLKNSGIPANPPPAAPAGPTRALGVPPSLQRKLERAAAGPGDASPAKAVRAILAVLKAHHPQARSRSAVALQAGYSAKGGSFQNALSQARVAGWIAGSAALSITAAGMRVAGEVPTVPAGKALVAYWLAHDQLGRVERQILKVLTDSGRRLAFPRLRVAIDAGYEASGGSFQNGLSRLRTLGLITGSREIAAAAEFFASR